MALLVNLVDCVYQAVLANPALVVMAGPLFHGFTNDGAGPVTHRRQLARNFDHQVLLRLHLWPHR